MLDVVVWFLLPGVFAELFKSDLRLPQALYEALSIYLLLTMGLKGGIEMSKQSLLARAPQVGACLALGFSIPFALAPVWRRLGLNVLDSAALAAHYGSARVVTPERLPASFKDAAFPWKVTRPYGWHQVGAERGRNDADGHAGSQCQLHGNADRHAH